MVPFMCAGARFEAHGLNLKGEFHPVPEDLWKAVIGFHRLISIEYRAESVSYHRWHDPDKEYHTIIPHQTTIEGGLSVKTNWQDPRNMELLDKYARRFGCEFFPACTIHTHVNTWAFESGTDAKDEEENPGWHITLGQLITHDPYDIDIRMRMPRKKDLGHIVHTGKPVKLTWRHLFPDFTEAHGLALPGTTDFHKFKERVVVK